MIDFIIAAVFILVIAISAFIGMKRGFLRMVAGFVEYIVAFLFAYVFKACRIYEEDTVYCKYDNGNGNAPA